MSKRLPFIIGLMTSLILSVHGAIGCSQRSTVNPNLSKPASVWPDYDPLFSTSFEDPRTSETYPIVDDRVIIQCKNAPELPEADSNDFDDETSDNTDYWDDLDAAIVASQCTNAGVGWSGTDEEDPYSYTDDYEINQLVTAEDLEVISYWPAVRAFCAILPEGQTVEDAVENWSTEYDDLIESVDPDSCGVYAAFPAGPPNDELYAATDVDPEEDEGQWNLRSIRMDEVWPEYTPTVSSEHRAKIAILDTGVEKTNTLGYGAGHEDLSAFSSGFGCNVPDHFSDTGFDRRYLFAYGNGRPRPEYLEDTTWHEENSKWLGHGTCVAGVSSATMDNDEPDTPGDNDIAGIADFQEYFSVAMDATMDPTNGDCMPYRSTFISAMYALAAVKGLCPQTSSTRRQWRLAARAITWKPST